MLALRSIARRVLQLTAEERELARELETITRKLAPQLLDQPGVGPHAPVAAAAQRHARTVPNGTFIGGASTWARGHVGGLGNPRTCDDS